VEHITEFYVVIDRDTTDPSRSFNGGDYTTRENGKRGGRSHKFRYIWTVPGVAEGSAQSAVGCEREIARERARVGHLPATITDTHGWHTYQA